MPTDSPEGGQATREAGYPSLEAPASEEDDAAESARESLHPTRNLTAMTPRSTPPGSLPMPDLDRSTVPEQAETHVHGIGTEPGTELSTCVIVPSYNEGRSVASVVASVHVAMPGAQVVVVNDGSTDDTAGQAARAGAVVITLPVNLGIGGAVQTGYRYALRHGFDVAMQIDGDGQHDPAEAARLLRTAHRAPSGHDRRLSMAGTW